MSSPTVPPSYDIPPRTIAGLPVTTFSYIFLAVGGAAPILFILLVIISVKCNAWRKLRRYQRYAAHVQATKDLWDFERSLQADDLFGRRESLAESDVRHVGLYRKGRSETDLHKAAAASSSSSSQAILPQTLSGAKLSLSNPNVYFKETPLLIISGVTQDSNSNSEVNRNGGRASHNETVTVHQVNRLRPPVDVKTTVARTDSGSSLRSEEARALACFDNIYEGLDSTPSAAKKLTGQTAASCACGCCQNCATRDQLCLVQTCSYPLRDGVSTPSVCGTLDSAGESMEGETSQTTDGGATPDESRGAQRLEADVHAEDSGSSQLGSNSAGNGLKRVVSSRSEKTDTRERTPPPRSWLHDYCVPRELSRLAASPTQNGDMPGHTKMKPADDTGIS